jgi:hypothetical protein
MPIKQPEPIMCWSKQHTLKRLAAAGASGRDPCPATKPAQQLETPLHVCTHSLQGYSASASTQSPHRQQHPDAPGMPNTATQLDDCA